MGTGHGEPAMFDPEGKRLVKLDANAERSIKQEEVLKTKS